MRYWHSLSTERSGRVTRERPAIDHGWYVGGPGPPVRHGTPRNVLHLMTMTVRRAARVQRPMRFAEQYEISIEVNSISPFGVAQRFHARSGREARI